MKMPVNSVDKQEEIKDRVIGPRVIGRSEKQNTTRISRM
jgi:hypothetical protein